MPTLLLGIVVLVLALWAFKAYSRLDPKALVRILRPAGGIVALGLAVFLGLRGHLETAIALGLGGLGLLGWGPFASGVLNGPSGQAARGRSAFIEIELDPASGVMRGRVLAGRFAGQQLDALDLKSLLALMSEIDPESRSLLAAYLDRRAPRWREHPQADADTRRSVARGKMTDEEAYQVLGVKPGASPEEIGRAHRSLMKKLHPDQGGSTYLAAKINEAKEVLMRRHR